MAFKIWDYLANMFQKRTTSLDIPVQRQDKREEPAEENEKVQPTYSKKNEVPLNSQKPSEKSVQRQRELSAGSNDA